MKRVLKVAILVGLVLVAVLAAGIGMAAKKEVPDYVGSQACLGCHSNMWSSWAGSGHATMMVRIDTTADIEGWDKATPEIKAEVGKADFVVSGMRYLARDKATGNLIFLKYEWDKVNQQWIDSDSVEEVWQGQCMGCHTTVAVKAGETNVKSEMGIGCEACHGPGKDHVVSNGDTSKITVNVSSDVCGQCHNSGYKMSDNRWIMGYKPNMKLTDVPGIIMAKVDPTLTANRGHHKEYPEWLVSAHGPKAVDSLKSSGHATAACYACHTQEAFAAKQAGETFTLDPNANYVGISCVTCHKPHSLGYKVDEQTLCTTCHTGSIDPNTGLKPGSTSHEPMKEFFAGYGAAGGIKTMSNVHKDITCQDCHMPNNNHLMHIVKPDDPNIAAGSDDSCTSCHKDSPREIRAGYLNMWQSYTSSKLTALNADVATIDAAVKAGKTLNADQQLKLATAKTNISFITADGSMGAHNFDYATKILTATQKDLTALKAAVK